ncbi:MAG TPA: rod shape-determining protein RodA, partial [Planctomycetaceae bacterium]|nr:rod shape-determining protein RodA [Planctomycetaceae bacterium]
MKHSTSTLSDRLQRLPWGIVVCTAFLLGVGLTAIARGDELAGGSPLATRQFVWIVIGSAGLVGATLPPYRVLRSWSYPVFALSLGLLAVVYVMPSRHGAHRWIPLGPINFQPSELAKLAYIFALAHYLMYRDNYRRLTGLLIPFLLTLLPVGLVLREPDLGTSLLFLPVLFAMLFAAGARPRHLLLVCALGLALTPLLWMGMSAEQKSRVVTLFLQKDGGPTPRGDGYHLHQSKRVLALGGVWGSELTGPATFESAAYHLPAARTDFVF